MKTLRVLLWFLCCAGPLAAAPSTIVLVGELTNTSADVSAPARLTLEVTDGKVKARLVTQAPLTGTGELTGVLEGGWCELRGALGEGVTLRLRGGLNARDFRGTYVAAVEGSLVQYGRFQLARTRAKE